MENKEKLFNYPYAKDDNGKPISITEIKKETRHNSHYYCYGCEAELFPVLGNIREHHFRHEKGSICDPDKYLHEFAKATLKKRFDENEHFIVKYYAHHKCKKIEDCNLFKQYHWLECEWNGFYSIDLKQYYDTCRSEKGYYQDLPNGKKKYIADLILSNSQKPKSPPTSLELWVTHECTEDKKKNGGRIIEIKINCEEDANRPIIENNDKYLPIHFYNFKNPIEIKPNRKFKHIKLLPSFKGYVVVTDETLCSEGLLFDSKGKHEIILSTTNLNVRDLKLLYAIKCNEKGITSPYFPICENGWIDQKKIYSCRQLYNTFNPFKCPCNKFKYSKQKGEEIMEQFKNIQIWESKNK